MATSEGTDEVYRAIDLSLRVGEILLSTGAGAADVAVTMRAVTTACGLRGCVIDVNFTTLAVSYQESPESPPETHLRQVQYRGLDYGYLSQVDELVRRLASGRVDRAEASQLLYEMQSTKRPYPKWLQTASVGLLAGGISMLLGGQVLVIVIAFLTAAVIDLTNRQLSRRRIPAFYQQVAGALIATVSALVLHELKAPVQPSLVIASGIIVLLAGISLVGAIQDALSGYYVTGAARSFEAILLTGAVIAGVSVGLSIAKNFGVELQVRTPTVDLFDLPVQLTGSVIATVAFAIVCQTPRRALIPCGLVGLLAQLIFQVSIEARLGPTAASSLAALGVGLVAFSVAGYVRVPPLVVVTTSIVALLPGLTIYRGLFMLLTEENLYGIVTLFTAASIAVALASGAILGEYIAQPLAREAQRLETRLSGPRLVGPLRPVPRRTQRRAARQLRKQQERDSDEGGPTTLDE